MRAKNLKALSMAVISAFTIAIAGCGSAPQVEGPVYLPSESISYYSDGETLSVFSYTYDEHGTLTSDTYTFSDGVSSTAERVDWEYDELGFLTRQVVDGEETTFENEVERGRVVRATASDGSATTYEYHPSGICKTMVEVDGTARYTTVFDEHGYCVSEKSEGVENPRQVDFEWSFDDSGNPVSCTATTGEEIKTYTFQCDEHGNIIVVYNSDGSLYMTKEYVRIDDPTAHAWLSAHEIFPDF